MFPAYLSGLQIGLGLIVAIGAQNAFVLRQGLRRQHVFAVAAFCAASDAVLILAGISGFALASAHLPWLPPLLKWAGVVFLLLFGARAFRDTLRGEGAMSAEPAGKAGLVRTLVALAVLTWANPQVLLETLVLIGGVAARYGEARWSFGAGAASGSAAFFFALAYGARAMAPLLSRPRVARAIDALVGAMMWSVAARLALAA